MVELQQSHGNSAGTDTGLAVYALSYDPVSTLARFADSHGITYPLLSDEDSAAITRLGILNVTVEEERAAYGRPVEDRHRGIPYPGSFVLDEDGILVGKRFEQSHRIRPTASTLVSTFIGSDGTEPVGLVSDGSQGVEVAAWLDTDVLYANQTQNLHVRLALDPGVHVYTKPVPEGFRALKVGVTGDQSLHAESVEPPVGDKFKVTGLGETFHVLGDTVDIAIPFFLLANRDTAGDGTRHVPLSVEISYQACTGDECFMPETITLELGLTEEPNPGYESTDLAALAPLVMRRIIEGPRTEAELMAMVNAALTGVEATMTDIQQAIGELEGQGLIAAENGHWTKA